jgi:tRNA dimethylallyltransferase
MSEQKANRQGIRGDFDCRVFLLERDRDELYARINRRVDSMLKDGLIEEVKKMKRKRLSMTAQMALGIREMNQVLSGERSLDEAAELLKQHTRNYAKRQLSWFRHEKGVETVRILESDTAAHIAKRIVQSLSQPHA